jgi:hypothetical protein
MKMWVIIIDIHQKIINHLNLMTQENGIKMERNCQNLIQKILKCLLQSLGSATLEIRGIQPIRNQTGPAALVPGAVETLRQRLRQRSRNLALS